MRVLLTLSPVTELGVGVTAPCVWFVAGFVQRGGACGAGLLLLFRVEIFAELAELVRHQLATA